MLRLVRYVAIALIIALGGAWGVAWLTKAPAESLADRIGTIFGGAAPAVSGLSLPQGISLGGPFSLTDQTGRPVTERDFAGRWMLLYFGYGSCPDVCPTELGAMASVMDLLGPSAAQVVPVFITIDPARDTVAVLADYVSRFHPKLIGLTGTAEQIAIAARQYRVYYAKVESRQNTGYLMDHSGFLYLVGPDGKVRSLFRPEVKPEDIAAAVASRLAEAGQPRG